MTDKITLAHGAGGLETSEILDKLFFSRIPYLLKKTKNGYGLDILDDGAVIRVDDEYFIVSTDSYTVKPLFFSGGNIGILAASGSINDVLMMGGKPIAMLDNIIVSEGFPIEDLEKIIDSFIYILKKENVPLINGDFKVLPRDSLDKLVFVTTAIGVSKKPILDKELKPGDKIIVTDYIGDHGTVILALQNDIDIGNRLVSDTKPLTSLMLPLFDKYLSYIHAARDPTRGGLAMTLNDWAKSSNTTILIQEEKVPIRKIVKRYTDMLGIDPFHLASEGVAVIGVDGDIADEVLDFIKELGYSNASIIGSVEYSERYNGLVILESKIGGLRILEPPTGILVPRIC